LRVGEGYIDAVVQRSPVHSRLDDLDCRIIARLNCRVYRQGHLWQTEGSRVRILAGPHDLECRNHRVGHVDWDGSVAEVDIEESSGMALKPAGLYSDGPAADGPKGAVLRRRHAAARINPLHPIWICIVGALDEALSLDDSPVRVEVISSPAGICNDGVCVDRYGPDADDGCGQSPQWYPRCHFAYAEQPQSTGISTECPGIYHFT